MKQWNGGLPPKQSASIVACGGESSHVVYQAQQVLYKYQQVQFIDNLLSNEDNFLNDPICQACLHQTHNYFNATEPAEILLLRAFNHLYHTNLALKIK